MKQKINEWIALQESCSTTFFVVLPVLCSQSHYVCIIESCSSICRKIGVKTAS